MFIPSCFALRNGLTVSSSDYEKTLCLWCVCVCVGHVPTIEDLTSLGLPNFWTNDFGHQFQNLWIEAVDLGLEKSFRQYSNTLAFVWQALHSFYPSHALVKFVALVGLFTVFLAGQTRVE